MKIRAKVVRQDMWVGAYWDSNLRKLYVCILPCLPVVISFHQWRDKSEEHMLRCIYGSHVLSAKDASELSAYFKELARDRE